MLSGPGYLALLSMYIYRAAKDSISKMQAISHLDICGFINFKVLSIGYLIYPYNC